MSNRIIAIIAATVLVIVTLLAVNKSVYGEKTDLFAQYESLEEIVSELTGEELDDIEEDLELFLTEHDYSDDIHEAGTINYDYLEKDICENSRLPRIDISMEDGYVLSKDYSKCAVAMSKAGEYNFPSIGAQVRIRGNWTSKCEKKPLKIKFDSRQSMFGREPEKSWVLIANFMDNTQIHNDVAYDLYDLLTPEGQFIPMYVYVDVYINDVYIGVYALSDQIDTGRGRIPISSTHGNTPSRTDYLIEQDFRLKAQEPEGENVYWFWSRYENIMYSVKSPEEDLTEEDLKYMRDYIDLVYILAKHGDYEEVEKLIDVDAFISYMLVQDITRNADVFKASIFYVKPAGKKLAPATVWDFDLTFGGLGGYPDGSVIRYNYLYDALMEMPRFREKYLDTFFERKDEIRDRVIGEIDRISSLYYDEFSNEYYNWEIDNTDYMMPEMNGLEDYSEQIEMMKWWFGEQMTNLEAQYGEMY